jgi:hypothetical protein
MVGRSLAIVYVTMLHLPGGRVHLSGKEDGRDEGGEGRQDLVATTLGVNRRRKT